MKTNLSLSIPNPCSEDWNSFTPTSTGGFCGSCSKNVIDFTKATDDEIIAFINNRPEHACGRFRSNQLKTYTLFPGGKIRPGFMLLKAGAVSLLLLLISKPSVSQSAEVKTNHQTVTQALSESKNKVNQEKHVIHGVVTDEQKVPLPGVWVIQRGTINAVSTNDVGEFTITLEPKASQLLDFSFIGLITQEINVSPSIRSLDIIMVEDKTQLGEIVITGEVSTHALYTEQSSGLKKFWNKIKNLF